MKPLMVISGCLAFGAVGLGLAYALVPSSAPAPAAAPAVAQAPVAPKPVAVGAASPVADAAARVAIAPPADATPRPPMAYRSFEVEAPYIALTFDDGPSPENTPKLLEMLKARGIKATFFVLGSVAAAHPDLLKRIAADGHEIGNHSWNHPQLTRISIDAVDKQIADTSDVIFNATGARPLYLRPPYGSMKPSLREHIEQKFGLSMIYWSVDPLDWKNRDSQMVYTQIMQQVKPGAIVLAHDIHATTVAAMPRVLDELIAKGYKFGTMSELIAMNKPVAPKVAAVAPVKPQKKAQKTQKPKAPGTGPATPASAPRPAGSNGAKPTRSAGLY